MAIGESGWVPNSCTLPTTAQPLRVAEFDEFFASAVQGWTRTSATRLDVVIKPGSETSARRLGAKESECCSFFVFDFTSNESAVVMGISVPETHVDVLDALETRLSRRNS